MGSEVDIRVEEVESIHAIYPEAAISEENFEGTVVLPVIPDRPIKVLPRDDISLSHQITAFPDISFQFKLPEKYPEDEPPQIAVSASWLPKAVTDKLCKSLVELWDQARDLVIYMMIDTLSHDILDYLEGLENDTYVVDSLVEFRALVEFDNASKIEAFNRQTFTCEICQEDKKGALCAQFVDCSHVYCIECLHEYFVDSLKAGDIEKVHCPDFECTKRQVTRESKLLTEFSSMKSFEEMEQALFMLPLSEEFLKRVVEAPIIERFVTLFHQQRLDIMRKEFPAKVVSCPRESCKQTFINRNDANSLSICPHCGFAFCRDCRHSWHGTTNICATVSHDDVPTEEVEEWVDSAEDSQKRLELSAKYGKRRMKIAVSAYLADKSLKEFMNSEGSEIQKCPKCDMLIQRSDGCNKMRCPTCSTMFCNLCGEFLLVDDPYLHFKSADSPCYGKLFEGLIPDEEAAALDAEARPLGNFAV